MKCYWSDTRPNGKPVEPGTVCWITDLEDGTHPIATYGKDQAEVMDKLAHQNAHAQMALARRTAPPSNPAAPATPAPARRTFTPDQIMRATTDLEDPSKAGAAVATLVESHTGLDLRQLVADRFGKLAKEWESETPDFYAHPGNVKLVTTEAFNRAGGNLGLVTKEHLTAAFRAMQAQGYLMDAPADDTNPPPSNTNTFPDENRVQRTERPRGTFATGARSTGFQRVAAQPRTPKYTEEDIRKMPLEKSKRLIETNDPDYAEACERYFGSSAQATA